jgi:protein involved in polysaccharide export with SLBB domain
VVVKIIDRSGRAVSFLYGAVKKPQRFQIKRPVRLNELIILSGGIDEKASGEIQILRSSSLNCQDNDFNMAESKENIGSKLIKVNIIDLIKGVKDANPIILNGDIITVTEADPIYVIGGVANPKQLNVRSQMTVSRAIASAGGFTKNADLKNIVVFRRTKNTTNRIVIDFNKIEANPSEDLVLQKYDIIDVAQNGAEKRKFAPIVKNYDNQVTKFEMPLRIID